MHIASLSSSSTYGNSYLVWDDDTRPVLIDCGVGLRYLLRCLDVMGFDPSDVAALFITHEHSDHIRGMTLSAPIPQRFGFPVFASRGFWEWYDECVQRYIDPGLRRVIGHGETVRLSRGLCVRAFSKPHDASEPLGFVVEGLDERVGFVTDLGHVPQKVERVLSGLEQLVFESNHDVEMEKRSGRPWPLIRRVLGDLGHLSNVQAGETLARLVGVDTRRVILAHLSAQCNTPDMAMDAVSSALDGCSGRPELHTAPAGDLAVYE